MESYIPDVYEEVVGPVDITTLSSRQYCVIVNPVGQDGKPQLGARKLVKGKIWKFHDFSITQILREINCGVYRSAKSAILTHSQALNFDFY